MNIFRSMKILAMVVIIVLITPATQISTDQLQPTIKTQQEASLFTGSTYSIDDSLKNIEQYSSQIDKKTVPDEDQQISMKMQFSGQGSLKCSINCLQCDQDSCIRYNWIGLMCLGLFILNVLALIYCILLIKKMRRRRQSASEKGSIITDSNSIISSY